MIMKVVPDRPGSADSATRQFERYKKDIDFFSSPIHGEAIEGWKEICRKKATRQQRSIGLEPAGGSIEERGEGEEDDLGRTGGLLGVNSGSKKSSPAKITVSNLNLLKQELEGSIDTETAATTYTQLECSYLLQIFKNRSVQAYNLKAHAFSNIYAKARETLKVSMTKLLLARQFTIIDKQYQLADNEKSTSHNLIKILLRCCKMYDAQAELTKIIHLIEERMRKLITLKKELKKRSPDTIKLRDLYRELVRLSQRTHVNIRALQAIDVLMQRPLMFNGDQYDGHFMHKQMKRKRL